VSCSDAYLLTSTVGGQGVNDVGTGVPAPIVRESDNVNLPVSAEIDIVEHEVEITAIVCDLGPVKDISQTPIKVIHAKYAGLEFHSPFISFSGVRVHVLKLHSFVKFTIIHKFKV
jgi:hypothetical protein